MFLTRRLFFSDDKRSWRGYYYHYSDALCRDPQFTIHAKGTYQKGRPSSEVQYAHKFNFRVTDVAITPDAESVADSLNRPMQPGSHCGKEQWERGKEQDVTPTGGCSMLGITVPYVEYELVKVEKHRHHLRLYLGQRPTVDTVSSPNTRPTSFQPPLVHCARGMNFTPPVTPRPKFRPSSASHLHSCILINLLSFLAALLPMNVMYCH